MVKVPTTHHYSSAPLYETMGRRVLCLVFFCCVYVLFSLKMFALLCMKHDKNKPLLVVVRPATRGRMSSSYSSSAYRYPEGRRRSA